LGARVVDVREFGDEQSEVHGDSFDKNVKLENVAPEWASSVSARARRVNRSTWEGTHQALQSGEVNGARRVDTSSRRSTRVRVGHGKLPGDVWPVRGTDVFNHTPMHARLRRRVNGVNEWPGKPGKGYRAAPFERAHDTACARLNGGHSNDAQGKVLRDCDAHRLPDGRTAAKGRFSSRRRAGQAERLFEGRLLQLSKAYAPFVEVIQIVVGTPNDRQ
jgi:hypothetical protein